MQLPSERPFSLLCSYQVVRAAAVIVPAQGDPVDRRAWRDDWHSRILSRWQFLHHTGLWNRREAVRLFLYSLLAFADAARQVLQQEPVRQFTQRIIRSPLSCLLVLALLLATIAIVTGGLPATRDLIFKRYDTGGGRLVFAWLHTMQRGGDHPLPSDVVPAWDKHGTLIQGAAPFRASHLPVTLGGGEKIRPLVVLTQPSFFKVLNIQPAVGAISDGKNVVLSYNAWARLFHADPRVLGTKVNVDREVFSVTAVLPPHAEPLTRQPVFYLLIPNFNHGDVFAALRVKDGVASKQLDTELIKIAEDFTYDFLQGQLRYSFAQAALLTPVWSLIVAGLSSAVLLLAVFRTKWSVFRQAFSPERRRGLARQTLFFSLKTSLALACVFTACLEWSRSSSAILFGTFDPASGPFLLWLYIAGTMAVFFLSALDQRARCRECLRLLAFPVRIGSPGSVLLNWSGTEFCCSEGHGVLHVPHLATSWSEESDRWIALDDSWQSLFTDARPKNE